MGITSKGLLVIFVTSCITFCAACKAPEFFESYPEDNFVEESIEVMLEDATEDRFGLPDGSLDGKIDFTPWSEEK